MSPHGTGEPTQLAILTPPGRGDGYRRAATEFFHGTLDVEMTETRIASGFPRNEIDLRLKDFIYAEAGLRARKGGCNAVLINTVCDYGLAMLRSSLDVPVVGAGQAAMVAASALGVSFSIVTVWPASTKFLYERLVREYGLEQRIRSLRHVTTDSDLAEMGGSAGVMEQMEQGIGTIRERVAEACQASIDHDGADTIVLGCCCMSLAAPSLREQLDVPVVDPFLAGCASAESELRLGLRQSRVAYPASSLADHRNVSAVVAALDPSAVAGDECNVCAIEA